MQEHRVKPATPCFEVLFSFAICQQPNPQHFVHNNTQFETQTKNNFIKNSEIRGISLS